MTRLRIYIRSGCHLCDDMLRVLAELGREHDFQLEVVDILGNPGLEEQHGQLVPVLCGEQNGDWKEICHYFLDMVALDQYFGTS